MAYSGVVEPEACAAVAALGEGAALLQVSSYDRLLNEWKAEGGRSFASELLADVPRDALIVSVLDGHAATLSWLGSVHGHRVRPLGVGAFGQTGDTVDLYAYYGIDTAAIVEAARA